MYEREMEKKMAGAKTEEAYNAFSGNRPAPIGIKGGMDAATVTAALDRVKDNEFWRTILKLEKKC